MLDLAIARPWYPDRDPVHGFDHVERVLNLAMRIAQAEGADLQIVQAAVLLHDATPPDSDEADRQTHHHSSAAFAAHVLAGLGWETDRITQVQHCIRAHRFRDPSEQPHSLEAQILFDADKLDAIGATGVARAVAYAACAGQPAFAEPSPGFAESGVTAPGEAHSAYHEHVFKLRRLQERLHTLTARKIAAERHAFMEAFFTRLRQEARGEA